MNSLLLKIIMILILSILITPLYAQDTLDVQSTTPVGTMETQTEGLFPNYNFAVGFRAGYIQPFGEIADRLSGGFSGSLFFRYNPNFLRGLAFAFETDFLPQSIDNTNNGLMTTVGFALGPRYSIALASFVSLSIYTNYGVMLNMLTGDDTEIDMYPNFLFKAGLDLDFELAYHSCITAGVAYQTSFESTAVQGLSATVSYAFQMGGEDQDSNLQIDDPTVIDIFPALFSLYQEDTAAGSITLTNVGAEPIEDLKVALYIDGVMDSPTVSRQGVTLNPDDSEFFSLHADFNSNIMKVNSDKTEIAQIILQYEIAGAKYTRRETVPFKIYSKNAITWDDLEKVCAFVSTDDPAINRIRSGIERELSERENASFIPTNVRKAMRAYATLKAIGLEYLSDPNKPFTTGGAVDTVQFPVEFLKADNRTGDCDDFAILYASLLESVGVQTGFILTSAHIYTMFNTGIPVQSVSLITENPESVIIHQGDVWIPIETTFLDKDQPDFIEAWQMGIQEYNDNISEINLVPIEAAWQNFPPVYLDTTADNIEQPDFSDAGDSYNDSIVSYRATHRSNLDRAMSAVHLADNLGPDDKRETAVELIRSNQPAGAIPLLESIAGDGDNDFNDYFYLATAYSQRGEDYQSAIDNFLLAKDMLTTIDDINTYLPRIYLNISQCYNRLGNVEQRIDYYNMANEMNPVLGRRFASLGGTDQNAGMSSDVTQEDIFLLLD